MSMTNLESRQSNFIGPSIIASSESNSLLEKVCNEYCHHFNPIGIISEYEHLLSFG